VKFAINHHNSVRSSQASISFLPDRCMRGYEIVVSDAVNNIYEHYYYTQLF